MGKMHGAYLRLKVTAVYLKFTFSWVSFFLFANLAGLYFQRPLCEKNRFHLFHILSVSRIIGSLQLYRVLFHNMYDKHEKHKLEKHFAIIANENYL